MCCDMDISYPIKSGLASTCWDMDIIIFKNKIKIYKKGKKKTFGNNKKKESKISDQTWLIAF